MMGITEGIKSIHKQLDTIRKIPKCVGCECVLDVMTAVEQDLEDIDKPIAKEVQLDLKQWVDEGNKVRHNCLGCEVCFPIKPYNHFSSLINGSNEIEINGGACGCNDNACGSQPQVNSTACGCDDDSCEGEPQVNNTACGCDENKSKNTHPSNCSCELKTEVQKQSVCGTVDPNDSNVASPSTQQEQKWPIAEGNYLVGNDTSFVAICTLADTDLPSEIQGSGLLNHISIVGTLSTENLGIERLIRNVTANPNISHLILCGRDSRGHQAGQAILSLKENGIDDKYRIIGAVGPRPVLKNITLKEIEIFRQRVKIVDEIGTRDVERLHQVVRAYEGKPNGDPVMLLPIIQEPKIVKAERLKNDEWVHDPEGFFLVILDRNKKSIRCEHYILDGTLNEVIEGKLASDIANTAIKRGLLSRLDHAAYLGKELAKAETALAYDMPYTQDLPLSKSKALNQTVVS